MCHAEFIPACRQAGQQSLNEILKLVQDDGDGT